MPLALVFIFLAGVAAGWVHDSVGRVGGTAVLLTGFSALVASSVIAPAGSGALVLRGLEALMGLYTGIAARGLLQHFRRKRAVGP